MSSSNAMLLRSSPSFAASECFLSWSLVGDPAAADAAGGVRSGHQGVAGVVQ